MESKKIRETFLHFFEQHGHQRARSSSLIPAADPTLLFTNAGMVQFKDAFLGKADLGFKRATTSQKCVRAGGKHNDLENVGFTPRHHTFFEMLGNFSFGDYFKKDAIAFAWELLTVKLQLPKDRLRITVYKDDDEALELWKKQGVRADWIERLGEKDNFWAMGDTGPCGPCTEIHFDWGARPGSTDFVGTDPTGRFLEIWNLVFMQFDRDDSGQLKPLPRPSVDTGAGLERMACVLQGVFSNYDTDLFRPILERIGRQVGQTYGQQEETSVSMRVISDHLRSSTFLIADGVVPSNEGRGYVLRRILRRAIRYGKKLGQEKAFIHQLVPSVVELLGPIYPEIVSGQKLIQTLIREEEDKFHETLHRGMGVLEDAIRKAQADKSSALPGDVAFKLYDTFGFPLDLVQVIASEHRLAVDEKGFERHMDEQRGRSVFGKNERNAALAEIEKDLEASPVRVEFQGYEDLASNSPLLRLYDEHGKRAKTLRESKTGYAVFSQTPFYAESGGQVGDKGQVHDSEGRARVEHTLKIAGVPLHRITVEKGGLTENKSYSLEVDPLLRQATAVNHTATHLLHAALRKVLGDRVRQAGSLVEPNRLRFDFTYPRGLTADELKTIETMLNDQIRSRAKVSVQEMSFDQATKSGALAFFDEKYGDMVRVVRVGEASSSLSIELCGGTHLRNIGEIVFFKILSESSVASGVRRIEAVTADAAIQFLESRSERLAQLEARFGASDDALIRKADQLFSDLKALQKSNEKLQLQSAQRGHGEAALWERAKELPGGIKLVAEKITGVAPKVLRTLVDQVRDKLKDKAVVALAVEADGKIALCLGISRDLTDRFDAGKLIQPLARQLGGSGGGKADFAQAGGSATDQLEAAFRELEQALKA